MTTLKRQPVPITEAVLPPFRICVFGEGGVGKTTFALSFPRVLVVDTDGGLEGDAVEGITAKGGEVWTPDQWKDLNDLYFWLKENVDKKGYCTIVIDSLDTLCRLILREATDMPNRGRASRQMNEELTTSDQQDYGKVSNALDRFLTNLKILSREKDVNIVLTSAVRYPDPEKGRKKRTFDVQPAVEAIVMYWANVYGELVLVNTNDGSKKDKDNKPIMVEHRVLWTNAADPQRVGKTRFRALRPGVTDPTCDLMRKKVRAAIVQPTTTAKATTKAGK
jgi:hypothetical protein